VIHFTVNCSLRSDVATCALQAVSWLHSSFISKSSRFDLQFGSISGVQFGRNANGVFSFPGGLGFTFAVS